jgi:ATP-dependent protease ClpP protease subunit
MTHRILTATLCIIFTFTTFQSFGNTPQKDSTKVYVEGNSIVYDGHITKQANDSVIKLYTKKIDRLILNSPGGEINLGMDLGEWVFQNNLDVEVKDRAFSSAANYVFVAGKNKYLYKSSMLGWHGGATSDAPWYFKLYARKYIKKAKAREKLFFSKIGVNHQIITYGQRPEFYKYIDENTVGWTYNLNALTKFNVNNIVLLDGVWNPSDYKFSKKKLFIITENEINLE